MIAKQRKSVRFSDSDSCSKDSSLDPTSDCEQSEVFHFSTSTSFPAAESVKAQNHFITSEENHRLSPSLEIGIQRKVRKINSTFERQTLVKSDLTESNKSKSECYNNCSGIRPPVKRSNSEQLITTNKDPKCNKFSENKSPARFEIGVKASNVVRPHSAPERTVQYRDTRSGQYFAVKHHRSNSAPIEVRIFKLESSSNNSPAETKFGKVTNKLTPTSTFQAKYHQHPKYFSHWPDFRESTPARKSPVLCGAGPYLTESAGLANKSRTLERKQSDFDVLGKCQYYSESSFRKTSTPPPRSNLEEKSEAAPEINSFNKKIPSANLTSSTENCDGTMSGTVLHSVYEGSMSSSQIPRKDKQELQDLNNRLSQYIIQVREMQQMGGKFESNAFMESIKILEDELVKMKDTYEKALEASRSKTEELVQERSQLSLQLSKFQQLASELENRLAIESDKSRRASEEKNGLQISLHEKSLDIESVKTLLRQKEEELILACGERDNALRDRDEFTKRFSGKSLDHEQLTVQVVQLQEKLALQEKLHAQKTEELTGRLQAASNTILVLEGKIRELSVHDNSLAEMLKQVRQAAEAEQHRYQHETREVYTRNITELKVQLDTSEKTILQLKEENIALNNKLGDLTGKVTSLEGQVVSLEHQRKTLELALESERKRFQKEVREMEVRLSELQELLVVKMREAVTASENQFTLRAELESYRALLAEEEKRLRRLQNYSSSSQKVESSGGLHMLFQHEPIHYSGNYNGNTLHKSLNTTSLQNPKVSSQPLGPVRATTFAPASQSRLNLVSTSLGQGKDYFDLMFNDLQRTGSGHDLRSKNVKVLANREAPPTDPGHLQKNLPPVQQVPPSMDKPALTTSHDYATATSTTIGNIKIMEIHPKGKYIRLFNSSNKDEEFGNFLLQQNVGEQPVAIYRFPPRLRFPSKGLITIWSGSNDPLLHQPPTDLIFKEQQKWGTGPECTTILCKPSGQAIAWTTAAHRFTQDAYDSMSDIKSTPGTRSPVAADGKGEQQTKEALGAEDMKVTEEELSVLNGTVNDVNQDSSYLRREKAQLPSLNAPHHPHGNSPTAHIHPHSGLHRSKTYGNDNSTVSRQSRIQSDRPDPIPGSPYAGAAAQKMGSARLQRYAQPTIQGSGQIANKSGGFLTGRPGSSFQTSRNRFTTGLEQVRSQHHLDFQPPMPRPPLFSAW